MKIAIVGFGGIGKSLISLINNKKKYLLDNDININVNYIINSTGGIYNSEGIDTVYIESQLKYNNSLSDMSGYSIDINSDYLNNTLDYDMLIELTPTNKETGQPGLDYIKCAINNKKHVVTANKGPILLKYHYLYELAKKRGVQLAIGCTAGGALPTVNAGLIDLAGSKITKIEGILNGTTNFIIKEMEDNNISYESALFKAQKLGIAEADPSLDVMGYDTASKLLILTNVLFNADTS